MTSYKALLALGLVSALAGAAHAQAETPAPGVVVQGSSDVQSGGLPAARVGDGTTTPGGGVVIYLLQGVIAGAVGWWLFGAARWSGFFLSLLAVIAAHAAHVVVLHFGGDPGWYAEDLVYYPEDHVRDYVLGTGGFAIGWLLLGLLRRGGRRRRSA